MRSRILNEFTVGDTIGGITVEIGVAICSDAMPYIRAFELKNTNGLVAKKIREVVNGHINGIRSSIIDESYMLDSKLDRDQRAATEAIVRAQATQAAADITDPIIAAKDAKIDALEAEIMAMREQRKGQVIGKLSRTRTARAKKASRK